MSTEFKLRAMTLRNFCIPPKMKISEIVEAYGNGQSNGCDYISFQSHQIVRFSDPQNSLSNLYLNVLEKERVTAPSFREVEQASSSDKNSSHIMQTFSLVGEERGFWEKKSPFLYITYVQTIDYDGEGYRKMLAGEGTRYDQLYQAIDEQLKGSDTKFILYYSYDFCDYILITSGFDIERQNELLWQMAMGKASGSFACIRDTFTFFAVQIECLRLDSKGKFSLDCREARSCQIGPFAIRFSAYSSKACKHIIKRLIKNRIPYEASRILGRYDLELRMKLSFGQFCQVLIWLDEATSKCDSAKEYAPFGGYEFMPSSPLQNPLAEIEGRIQRRDRRFPNFLIGQLHALHSTDSDNTPNDAIPYLEEAKRSLLELIENGFSTEFILGVIEPFFAAYKNLCAYPTASDDFREATQRVFHALNTLALCMMHGERRFIQAPAFNANYFDIPPKLFAFYSTVIRRVTDVYQSHSALGCSANGAKDAYRFLMVPDYRNNIFVNPIKSKNKQNKPYVCLIYLAEKYFYDPVKAIYLILQETAHYLSNRKREERIRCVFHTVARLMVFFVAQESYFNAAENGLSALDKELEALCKGTSIYGKLAEAVVDFLVERYEYYFWVCISPTYASAEEAASEKYHYRNIKDFLIKTNYGVTLFEDSQNAEEIKQRWTEIAEDDPSAWDMVNAFVWTQLNGVAMSSDTTPSESGNYLGRLFANHFYARLTDFSTMQMSNSALNIYCQLCEEIILDFQEAFADYRMAEMLDDLFDPTIYKNLLEEIPFQQSDFGTPIRYAAVMRAAMRDEKALSEYGVVTPDSDRKETAKELQAPESEVLFHCTQFIGIIGITDYLKKCGRVCRRNDKNLKALKNTVRVFSSGPDQHMERCLYVLQELNEYMKYLIGH